MKSFARHRTVTQSPNSGNTRGGPCHGFRGSHLVATGMAHTFRLSTIAQAVEGSTVMAEDEATGTAVMTAIRPVKRHVTQVALLRITVPLPFDIGVG